jgi:lysophospholipase L1-like esterase
MPNFVVENIIEGDNMHFRYLLTALLSLFFIAASAQQSHYQERVASFSQMRPVDSTDVVMLGTSQVEYAGDWNKLLNWRHVRNRGIAGDDAAGMTARLGSITKGHPKAIFLLVGIDELYAGKTVAQAYESCIALISHIRKQSPQTRLFVQSVLPINEDYNKWPALEGRTDDVAALNVKLRHYCEAHHIAYINVFKKFIRHGTYQLRRELTEDGLHLSPFGYKIWAFVLRNYLLEL